MAPGYQLHVAGPQTQMMSCGLIFGWTQHAWNPPTCSYFKAAHEYPRGKAVSKLDCKSTIKPMQHNENDGRKVPGRGINSPFLELDGSEMVLLLGINLHGYEVSQLSGS